jgi:hypothetical protein
VPAAAIPSAIAVAHSVKKRRAGIQMPNAKTITSPIRASLKSSIAS